LGKAKIKILLYSSGAAQGLGCFLFLVLPVAYLKFVIGEGLEIWPYSIFGA
jgi:hypothetical protein